MLDFQAPAIKKLYLCNPFITMSKSKKSDLPVILITNDDGIMAPGILNLVEAVKDLGKMCSSCTGQTTVRYGSCYHHRTAPATSAG